MQTPEIVSEDDAEADPEVICGEEADSSDGSSQSSGASSLELVETRDREALIRVVKECQLKGYVGDQGGWKEFAEKHKASPLSTIAALDLMNHTSSPLAWVFFRHVFNR